MNKVEVSIKQLSLNFEATQNSDPELRPYWENTKNRIEYDKYLNKAFKVSLLEPMPRRKLKEFILGLVFLVALCFAVLDSRDLSIFVLTKVAAFLIFIFAYCEYKNLWNRRDRASKQENRSRERRRKFKADAMGFFEGRNPIAYSVLYEPKLCYKRLCSLETGGITGVKWTH